MSALIYIHGFNSSPQSHKAQRLGQWLEQHRPEIDYQVPKLHHAPATAAEQLRELIDSLRAERRVFLVGSSLGGYYATYFAEQYGLRAALLNPSVKPYETIAEYLGENINLYTGERYHITAEHIDQLRELDVPQLRYPAHYFLLVQTGDETLDYRQAVAKFDGCTTLIERGGDHGFQQVERWFTNLLDFFERPLTES